MLCPSISDVLATLLHKHIVLEPNPHSKGLVSETNKHTTIHHLPHHFIKHAKSYYRCLSVVVLCFLIKPDGIVRRMMDGDHSV